eukprot:gene9580-7507_t
MGRQNRLLTDKDAAHAPARPQSTTGLNPGRGLRPTAPVVTPSRAVAEDEFEPYRGT